MKDSRHVYEGKDGAIEDIITGNITRSRLQSAVNHTCLILCMKGHFSLKQRISKPTNTTQLFLNFSLWPNEAADSVLLD